MPFALLVHGGAGPWAPDDREAEAVEGCRRAARRGYWLLSRGASALDAVEAAVVALEDDPAFNAGTGSCLNAAGEVEMDASIMDGRTLCAGAVAALRAQKNPVRLARAVMERTPHVLLCGEGASQLAREVGMAECDPRSLVTARALRRFEQGKLGRPAGGHGTVGAVALDARGHVAAATSTGGITLKRAGRVGDSPLIGAGTYADNLTGAVSCTGQGEAIIKVVLAKSACDLLGQGQAPAEAAAAALRRLGRVYGQGGLILVDRAGRVAGAFNTERMARAWVDASGAEGAAFGR